MGAYSHGGCYVNSRALCDEAQRKTECVMKNPRFMMQDAGYPFILREPQHERVLKSLLTSLHDKDKR